LTYQFIVKPKIMHLKNLVIICIMTVSTSFISIKPDKSPLPVDAGPMHFHSKFLFSDSAMVAYFECENFASEALDNYSIATINHAFVNVLTCTKRAVVNKEDDAVTDTIYRFSNTNNVIEIYRSAENDFVFTFDVRDSLFRLAGDIKPGMTKELFSRKFYITEAIQNKVQIANSEGSTKFMFYFENDSLKRINSFVYLD